MEKKTRINRRNLVGKDVLELFQGLIALVTTSGWWLSHPSEKYELVSWDDDIPNINGKINLMAVPNHQPAMLVPFH